MYETIEQKFDRYHLGDVPIIRSNRNASLLWTLDFSIAIATAKPPNKTPEIDLKITVYNQNDYIHSQQFGIESINIRCTYVSDRHIRNFRGRGEWRWCGIWKYLAKNTRIPINIDWLTPNILVARTLILLTPSNGNRTSERRAVIASGIASVIQ